MKILITGAAGFIGSHLIEYLLKDGVSVNSIRLFVENGESLANIPNKEFNIIYGDIRNKRTVRKAMAGIDTVFHLASLIIDPANPDADYLGVNVDGTKNLLNECKSRKIKKFVFFSSIAVYGLPAWAGDRININEDSPKDPREAYGVSKLAAENEVYEAHKKWGLPYVIIRPTSVYGPRDKRNLLELYKVINRGLFFHIGSGRNKMDYVYAADIARAARLAELSKLKNEDFIIGGGKPLSLNEIVRTVAESIDKRVPNYHVPKIVALGLSYAMKFTSSFTGLRLPLFPDRVRVMTANCYYDIGKARKMLGYKPHYTFEKGAALTGKWFLENYQ